MKKYILIDPNNDTGNDDGILDSLEMTTLEAIARNDERRRIGSDLRWISIKSEPHEIVKKENKKYPIAKIRNPK